MDLNEGLTKIIKEYPSIKEYVNIRNKKEKGLLNTDMENRKKEYSIFLSEFKEYIQELVFKNTNIQYSIKYSSLAQSADIVAYITITNPEIHSISDNYYLTYLFKPNGKGVYLSLGLGVNQFKEFKLAPFNKNDLNKIKDIASKFRNHVKTNESNINFSKYSETCDLESDKNLAKAYGAGNIYCKYYELNEDENKFLPSANELQNDLVDFIDLYQNFIKYNDYFSEIKNGNFINSQDTKMWMVRAGARSFLYDEFKKNNVVAIGWELGDLSGKSLDDIKQLMAEKYRDGNHAQWPFQVFKFVNEFKIGDYVVTYDNKSRIYLLGRITSDYYHSKIIQKTDDYGDHYWDLRDVKWLGEISRDNLNESTQKSLNGILTIFNINEDAKKDILNSFEEINMDSAKIIRNYLDANNLGNFEKEKYEEMYLKFKKQFAPKILEKLEGEDILNIIFQHEGDQNNLCYNLEFSQDYNFAGGIGGGSTYKFGLFKANKTSEWITGSSRKKEVLTEVEAIEVGSKIRDALVQGAYLIQNSSLNSINDYTKLDNDLNEIFSSCNTSATNQWVHKYYCLIFPNKFPIIHWDKMKIDNLNLFGITPQDGYYTYDGQLYELSRDAGIKFYSLFDDEIKRLFEDEELIPFESNLKRNIIYFGAPGTGKSYNLNIDKEDLLQDYEDNYERVTFHPDYSYANFVGTYKPVPDGDSITYKYVPGPFMRILKEALDKPQEPFLLIIEEINRANVAAVFGDIFQLLDRNEDNISEYDIATSEDMKTYINEDRIRLPSNLFIWATMNSADQGVFPMDTAFKRRWDFKYFSINNNENLIENINVNINNKEINWNILRKAINDELLSYKINEDKLMGPFFAFTEFINKNIDENTFKDIFKNKIIMYLFEDASRAKRNDLFSGAKTNNYVTYSEITEKFDDIGIEIFSDSIISKVIGDED